MKTTEKLYTRTFVQKKNKKYIFSYSVFDKYEYFNKTIKTFH